jgi:hypothetical protein
VQTLDPTTDADKLCLTLARLKGVHLKQDAGGWHVAVSELSLNPRQSLLPTQLLQSLLLAEPPAAPPPAGPEVLPGALALTGKQLSANFTQPLAAGTVTGAAFAVNEFVDGVGWKGFNLSTIAYTPGSTSLTFTLDRAPTGKRLRLTVIGAGPTPLLGATFIPAGALSPESDGRNLSTTLSLP